MKKALYATCGWCFVLLAIIGVVLPLLPTTPFLILASACFAKSSVRFHQMLLNNRWFGADIKRWEKTRSMSRQTKKRATLVIVVTFSISIGLLHPRFALQLMLVGIALVLLGFMWRIKE
ncbi:YbaN family protein [Paraglaciecola aquimarina]|uniref:Inner membrane protein n=1 Tax=Paraglaciecola aquimarina TaxID=1235557 RepID=A0ABU3SX41_9ALTE|nr:YbaN family protein [Paraglaciecola aquimarina]MDU0354583.1 YbaN family protein [Paraglaciecola aquimarina]